MKREDEATTRADKEFLRRGSRNGNDVTGGLMSVALARLDFSRFAYRWMNAEGARIYAKTVQDNWSVMLKEGDGVVEEDGTDLGSAISYVVGAAKDGSPLRAYLCRKPKTFFDEDQVAKAAELDKQLAELRRGNDRSGGKQADYIPNEGIRGL